jgi:hypothetical protein
MTYHWRRGERTEIFWVLLVLGVLFLAIGAVVIFIR